MTILLVVLTVLVAAEFVFAPFNLWSGRTMDNYRRYTGLLAFVIFGLLGAGLLVVQLYR